MDYLEREQICIFCTDHLTKEGKKPILLANDTWSLVPNDYPYAGTLHHFLMIPRQHLTSMVELSSASRRGYWDLMDVANENYGLSYFGLGCRNGDPRYTGATIMHLHIHLIVGDPDNTGEPVKLFLSSRPVDSPPPA